MCLHQAGAESEAQPQAIALGGDEGGEDLVEIGLGKRSEDALSVLLAGKERAKSGFTVPARGLVLVSVRYGPEGGS